MQQIKASQTILQASQKETFPYKIKMGKILLQVNKGVFSPKYFFGWKTFHYFFPEVKGKTVLEIGSGTGITALYLAGQGAKKVLAVDISIHAVKNIQDNIRLNQTKNVEVRKSNIFSAVTKDEAFDIIYWNMPFIYRQQAYKYKSTLEKGLFDPGYKITDKFLKNSRAHLNKNGIILIGSGDFGNIKKLTKLADKYKYKILLIGERSSKEINKIKFQLYRLTPKP